MNRRLGVVLAAVALVSCSSTDAPSPGAAGASPSTAGDTAAGGSGAAGSAAAGASPGSHAGAGADNAGAGAGGTSAAGTSGGEAPVGGGGSQAGAGAPSVSGAGGLPSAGGAGGSAGTSASAGTGGNAGGNAGGAGAPAKYCDTHPLVPAPVIVTEAFDDDQVGTDLDLQLTEHDYPDVCDEPAEANAVGTCIEWEYTPKTGGGSIVKLQYISDPSGIKYAPVCMAAGMTRVTFAAKGKVGGEVVGFGASQATTVYLTLADSWAQYSISLANVKYNTDLQGVQPAFFWIVDPAKNPGAIEFAVDDIKYVND